MDVFGESFIRMMDGALVYYDNKSESYEYYVEDVKYANARDFSEIVANLYIHLDHPIIRIEQSVVNGINIVKVRKK